MRGDVFAAVFSVDDAGITAEREAIILPRADAAAFARERNARLVGPAEATAACPHARGAAVLGLLAPWPPPADLAAWEPDYGRPAEAQARWEAAHGRALAVP
jgi:hypothetical protein